MMSSTADVVSTDVQKRAIRSRLIIRWSVLIVLAMIVSAIMPRLNIVFTESIDGTLFWKSVLTPATGDYVMLYEHDQDIVSKEPILVTKKITCGPGQQLDVIVREYYCDGAWLGTARTETHRRQPLTAFLWSGPVPAGKAFVMGTHVDSFDSRYLGFQDIRQMTRMIKIY